MKPQDDPKNFIGLSVLETLARKLAYKIEELPASTLATQLSIDACKLGRAIHDSINPWRQIGTGGEPLPDGAAMRVEILRNDQSERVAILIETPDQVMKYVGFWRWHRPPPPMVIRTEEQIALDDFFKANGIVDDSNATMAQCFKAGFRAAKPEVIHTKGAKNEKRCGFLLITANGTPPTIQCSLNEGHSGDCDFIQKKRTVEVNSEQPLGDIKRCPIWMEDTNKKFIQCIGRKNHQGECSFNFRQ